MKSFTLFTHKNKQENRTAAILKIKTLKKKDEERERNNYDHCHSHGINKLSDRETLVCCCGLSSRF